MGMGIDTQVCLNIVDTILRTRFEKKDFRMVSRAMVQCILKNNWEAISLVHGNAIDPARIRQADLEVIDYEFVKLESFILLLHSMGEILWKPNREIPKENLYNMEKIATNIYDHRWMPIGTASDFGSIFHFTPGEHGIMLFHIILALTFCENGCPLMVFLESLHPW